MSTPARKMSAATTPVPTDMVTPRFPDSGVVGIPDQYADGIAARVWRLYIGGTSSRTLNYKDWLISLLRENNCQHILDVACGTGIDSMMLVENGFSVQSCDASDKMLKFALNSRWERRNEPGFSEWVINEGNWLNLAGSDEINETKPEEGFDSLICLGNSFAHLLDEDGDGTIFITALKNFHSLLKPGGILVIDIRNYDSILDTGTAPKHNIYYTSERILQIRTSILKIDNAYRQVILDYNVDVSKEGDKSDTAQFRLSYFPHRREQFREKIQHVFGKEAKIDIVGDYKKIDGNKPPGYWIFVVEKN